MASRNEDEIKQILKTDTPDGLESWTPKTTKEIKIDHMGLSNTLAKIVSIVKMPAKSKDILLYKIANPGTTNFQLALESATRLQEIDLFEQEGLHRVGEYLRKHDVQSSIDKSNMDRAVNVEMMNIKARKTPDGANKME